MATWCNEREIWGMMFCLLDLVYSALLCDLELELSLSTKDSTLGLTLSASFVAPPYPNT